MTATVVDVAIATARAVNAPSVRKANAVKAVETPRAMKAADAVGVVVAMNATVERNVTALTLKASQWQQRRLTSIQAMHRPKAATAINARNVHLAMNVVNVTNVATVRTALSAQKMPKVRTGRP